MYLYRNYGTCHRSLLLITRGLHVDHYGSNLVTRLTVFVFNVHHDTHSRPTKSTTSKGKTKITRVFATTVTARRLIDTI